MIEDKKLQEQPQPGREAESELPDALMDAAAGGGSDLRFRKNDPAPSSPMGNGISIR